MEGPGAAGAGAGDAAGPAAAAEGGRQREDAPKLLADLVEAVLGGVLMDSDGGGGQGLSDVWRAFQGLAIAAGMRQELRI